MWSPCPEGSHEWEPIPNWCGRYRCKACFTIAYRGVVLGTVAGNRAGRIIPYVCPKCHGVTTKWRRKRVGEYRVIDGSQPCPRCSGSHAPA